MQAQAVNWNKQHSKQDIDHGNLSSHVCQSPASNDARILSESTTLEFFLKKFLLIFQNNIGMRILVTHPNILSLKRVHPPTYTR